jgi:predicted ferric reductase
MCSISHTICEVCIRGTLENSKDGEKSYWPTLKAEILEGMEEPRTEIVYLGQRKLISLKRKRDAIQVLGLLALWIPVLAFASEGGFLGLDEPRQLWSALNRLSALVATSLLMVHIALVARIPWIEQVLGLDKLTGAHKKLGKPLLYMLVFHMVAAGVNYGLVDGSGIVAALLYLNLNFISIALATGGLALMGLVVVSSIRIARKKLSYESWYLVHLLSYIAILMSIPHQYEFGTDFLAQPMLQNYFTLLYVFVTGNLVWFRVLQPVLLSLMSGLAVSSIKTEANRTTSITISGRRIERLGAEAGQFFLLRVLTKSQWWRPHPFSVSSAPSNVIRFTVGNRGDDTALLQEIQPGTRVILEGPFGVFSESKRTRRHVTLLAAGIGIAPIRALAESLAAEPGDVTVIYRVTDESDAALLDEVKRICNERQHGLELVRGPRPASGSFLPDIEPDERQRPDYVRLLELSPMIRESDVYICGPAGWSKSVVNSLKHIGINNDQIHLEEFAW